MNIELKAAILNMKWILADIPIMIAHVIAVAYKIQTTECNIDIEKTNESQADV